MLQKVNETLISGLFNQTVLEIIGSYYVPYLPPTTDVPKLSIFFSFIIQVHSQDFIIGGA